MDDFGMLARDFGFRPQGKSAPMKSDGADRPPRSSSPFVNDQNSDDLLFTDVFGGPPKYSNKDNKSSSMSDYDYDSIFKNESKTKSSSSVPVYDKPVYDEDIFDGLPGLKSKSVSSSARYEENVFASLASPAKNSSDQFDELLGNFGKTEKVEPRNSKSSRGFDDLIPGFGSNRPSSVSSQPSKPNGNSNRTTSSVMDDPFVVIESPSPLGDSSSRVFTDPLEEISKLGKSGNTQADGSSVSGGIFDDIDPLNGFGKSVPAFSSEVNNRGKDGSPSRAASRTSSTQNPTSKENFGKSSFKFSESHSQKKVPVDDLQDSHQTLFDIPTASTDSHKSFGPTASSPTYVNANFNETNSQIDTSPRSDEHMQAADDAWLSVSEIPLFTQPTSAPPPSRPPPPIPGQTSKSERGSFSSNTRNKGNEYSSSPNYAHYSQSPKPFHPAPKSPVVSPLDELEDFAMGRTRSNEDENVDMNTGEEMNTNSHAAASAAAMKEAMVRAEAKFRHAKEVKEREYAKAARSKEAVQLERDEEATPETRETEFDESQERLDRERQQREEEEREHRRLEKERERAREIEREKARQAVDRATREARDRAAAGAREKAVAETRLKAERAAVQRAQAEARERAAADAKGRAERAAAEARERANAEVRERANAEAREKEAKEAREKAAVARAEADARRRAERVAVERVAAQARERAAADARQRAAAASAARMNPQQDDNDLESFFSSRPSSAPRPRASSSNPVPDPQPQSKGGPESARRTASSGVSSNMKKASSATNIVDDLSAIFGAAGSSGDFPDIVGETDERRRARLERHQRTQERAAKALAEKNQRDLQTQRDQEERHRVGETLDVEIKRWAAGKEGNLRALLSTLQYVLWPECGWQPVSLTDLITGASVKKVYRKATLCIHPDKVQQKGANVQQKYIAEKVFDLLKEAWNKFNSEELF